MTGTTEDGTPRAELTGVILAGGRARRMGGQDKGLVEVNGAPMVAYVARALRPQVGRLLINANRNVEAYARVSGCEVVSDRLQGFAGPLAGMASAFDRARGRYLLTVPCDSPLIPGDLAERLHGALAEAGAEIAVAHDGERMQPVFALIDRDLQASLEAFLARGGRKIDAWYAAHRVALADLSDRPETFLNVNTPEERAALEDRLRAARPC